MAQRTVMYGTPLHSKIVRAIRERVRLSQSKMQERYEEWERVEKEMVSYMPVADAERKAKGRAEDTSYTKLHIPYAYGMLLTSHTYYSSVFLSRSPIHQVQGLHGEGMENTMAHEALMAYQVSRGGHVPHYMVWLLDVAKYGVGIIGDFWDVEEAQVSNIVERAVQNDGVLNPTRTEKVKEVQRVTTFEGNRVYNVRPFDFVVDPRVSLMNFQDGEFAGRKVRTSMNDIYRRQAQGRYFNIEALRENNTEQSTESMGYGVDGNNPALVETEKTDNILLGIGKDKNFVNLVELFVDIVPQDWGLGEGTYPEKWVFTLANDNVLIGCQPLGLLHNKYPFSVLEKEVDGHGLSSRGLPTIGQPMSQTLDFLVNSHFYNVQKTLNNEYIVDPTMINVKDFASGGKPGKLIRLKPMAYGKDVRTAIHQLTQYDVTRTHLQDMRIMEGYFQKVFGISDQLMGALNTTGRKSATEIRTSSSFGINRLKTESEFFSATGWDSLSQRFIQNNMQLYSGEQKYRIAGNNIQNGEEFISVTPELLAGMYGIVPVDGTLPVDRMMQANLWKEILSNAARLPQDILMGYDWAAIFGWMAKLGGLKNIDQFKRQGMEVPQMAMGSAEALKGEAQKGNIVPVGQGGI